MQLNHSCTNEKETKPALLVADGEGEEQVYNRTNEAVPRASVLLSWPPQARPPLACLVRATLQRSHVSSGGRCWRSRRSANLDGRSCRCAMLSITLRSTPRHRLIFLPSKAVAVYWHPGPASQSQTIQPQSSLIRLSTHPSGERHRPRRDNQSA